MKLSVATEYHCR